MKITVFKVTPSNLMDGVYFGYNIGVINVANGRRKIAVIGAGNVGATCAFVLAQMKIADVVMLDIFDLNEEGGIA